MLSPEEETKLSGQEGLQDPEASLGAVFVIKDFFFSPLRKESN